MEDKIKEKMLWKHGIRAIDIREALFDNPYVMKINKERFMAISHNHKLVTRK